MKIGLVLRELHRSENNLAHELLQGSEHNKVDQEMYHLARDLAGWSQRHISADRAGGPALRRRPEYGAGERAEDRRAGAGDD